MSESARHASPAAKNATHLPEENVAIGATRGQHASARRKGDAQHFGTVATKRACKLARTAMEDLDGFIARGRRQNVRVLRRKGQRIHAVRVRVQLVDFLARLRAEDLCV